MGGDKDVPSVASKFVNKAVKGGPTKCKAAMIYSTDAILFQQAQAKMKVDFAATWAYVPDKTPQLPDGDLSLHIYFHGNSNYVTVDPATGACTKPDWMPSAMSTPCTIEKHQLVQSAEDHHQPIVLAPEDANADRVHTAVGSLRDDKTSAIAPGALGAFVSACFRELSNLDKDSSCSGGKKYLKRNPPLTEIKRLFLNGHSGGGKPLSAACRADFVKSAATDLGLLDCTYGWGNTEYVEYCTDKKAAGKIGNAKGQSRLLSFYTSFPETETDYVKMRTQEEEAKKKRQDAAIEKREQERQKHPEKNLPSLEPYTPKTEDQLKAEWPTAWSNCTLHNARDMILKGLVTAKFTLASPASLRPLTAKPATGWPAGEMLHLETGNLSLIEDALKSFPIVFVHALGVAHDDFPNTFIPLILKTANVV